ncbi:MAG: hypothetical protein DRQ55_15095 [Planctomycetota bacterium]|nr:MAG: hypothetical protein DRQ55_15095 [Planctomycetota bacterium]
MLVLGLGALGFVTWQIWPQVQEAMQRTEEYQSRLLTLEESFPFDAETQTVLDAQRFNAFLDMRTELRIDLQRTMDETRRMEQQATDDDLGTIARLRMQFTQFPMVYDPIVGALERHDMSLNELGYYVQVLWATLGNIDAGGGGGDAQLDQLRGLYPKLQLAYRSVVSQDSPKLADLVAHIDPAVVSTARKLMATDVPRVQAGMLEPPLEAVCLALATSGLKVQMGPVAVNIGGPEDAQDAPENP